MEIHDLLMKMLERDASDLYLTAESPPMLRIEGTTQPVNDQMLTTNELSELADSIMDDRQKKEFTENLEMNLALAPTGQGRFRVNIFRQNGSVAIVIRQIRVEILTLDQLGLPTTLKDVAMTRKGLVLVVGGTGSGKSTTLAAMIDHRNSTSGGHIISVEDPIEFVHRHKKSIVSQREVGFDTHSFPGALKNAMRQAPDVILIGEIRDTETMESAITFADTGHLCLGTLHSTNANQCFERILNFFPEARRDQVLMQLSLNLRCIVSQRLVPSENGKRIAALEILVDTPRIMDLIRNGEVDVLKEAMELGIHEGCQTFDHALLLLYKEGKIGLEQALAHADSTNNLRLKIKMEGLKGTEAMERLLEETEPEQDKAFRIRGSG